GNFFRLADASQRNHVIFKLALAHLLLSHRGANDTGDNSIHSNVVGREISRRLPGERIDRAFGYRISCAAGARSLAGAGGDVDDGSASLFSHHLAGVLNAEKITGQINGHDPVPFIKRDVQYATAGGVSHAINQDIQAPMLFANMIEHRGHLFVARDVSREIVAANFSSDFFSVLLVARLHDYLLALSSEGTGNAKPDVMSRSRN